MKFNKQQESTHNNTATYVEKSGLQTPLCSNSKCGVAETSYSDFFRQTMPVGHIVGELNVPKSCFSEHFRYLFFGESLFQRSAKTVECIVSYDFPGLIDVVGEWYFLRCIAFWQYGFDKARKSNHRQINKNGNQIAAYSF